MSAGYRQRFNFSIVGSPFRLLCIYSLVSMVLCSSVAFAQSPVFSLGLWKLQSLNGELGVEGRYTKNNTLFKTGRISENGTKTIVGKLFLNSKSIIWHPNFLIIESDIEYNPGVRRDNFLIITDRNESNTFKKLTGSAVFFSKKAISLGFFANLSQTFINREFATSVQFNREKYSGTLSFQNSILPFRAQYSTENLDQKELLSGRRYLDHTRDVQVEINEGFTSHDAGRFVYSYNTYTREHSLSPTYATKISNYKFTENIRFNKENTSAFNSNISYLDQTGSRVYKRFNANEDLRIQLPWNFSAQSTYQYYKWKQEQLLSDQANFINNIQHQLFKSLHNKIYIESAKLNHNDYDEETKTIGWNVQYQKKIPTGSLRFTYAYRKRSENRTAQNSLLRIIDEQQILDDSKVVLLANAFVDIQKVVVTDETGAKIYQENIDYVLISRGDFVEIQRLPGGQILQGETVYIDYLSQQESFQKFESFQNAFTASLSLFSNFLEIYGRKLDINYKNVELSDIRLLQTLSNKVLGTKIEYEFMSAGYEINNFKSNIVPYRSKEFFSH